MHRAILEACFPYFLWLLAGFAGLWLLARVSGARLSLARLRSLHRSQEGSVQTLSFVLTLLLFMMIVLFIVQVSQLMIGITIVHYAAFAAARAASVWLPAHTPSEPVNTVNGLAQSPPNWSTGVMSSQNGVFSAASWKCQKVWTAAVMACYPIAPSKQYLTTQGMNGGRAQTTVMLYQALVPASASNPKIPMRILNKATYAAQYTRIQISGTDYDDQGPASYNPINHPDPNIFVPPGVVGQQYGQIQWQRSQIGWQDPITVQVWFQFPLLTGPGRFLSPGHFLSARLAPPDGTPDKVSSRIQVWRRGAYPNLTEDLFTTELTATATITAEGLISVVPYVHQPENIN